MNDMRYLTAQTIYHNAKSTGLGFAIGNEYDDISEATINAGWRVLERYDISLLRAADSAGNEFLVGGDGMGQGAWVIGLPYDVETEEVENPANMKIFEIQAVDKYGIWDAGNIGDPEATQFPTLKEAEQELRNLVRIYKLKRNELRIRQITPMRRDSSGRLIDVRRDRRGRIIYD